MKQKIEWYREVLELEPVSRVFFPLARLLAADNKTHEAIATLRQGTLRHPDHFEARLLLIELLHTEGEQDGVAELVDAISGLLRNYPHFWQAWSEKLSQSPPMRAAALSLRFFGMALLGKNIDWGTVIEAGLTSILDQDDLWDTPKRHSSLATDQSISAFFDKVNLPQVSEVEGLPHLALDEDLDVAEDEADEAFSLRTRAMADVLAEQGDNAGSLEIYRELAATASAEDLSALEVRIAELAQKVAYISDVHASQAPSEPELDKNRVVELLESLAQRLEARAQ